MYLEYLTFGIHCLMILFAVLTLNVQFTSKLKSTDLSHFLKGMQGRKSKLVYRPTFTCLTFTCIACPAVVQNKLID